MCAKKGRERAWRRRSDRTKSDYNIWKKRTLYLELRMRGEIKLTYKIIPLNGETSDTNDNVKTKINTQHMKPNNDVTHLAPLLPRGQVVTLCTPLQGDGVYGRILPTQVMSPTTTSSRRLMSRPSQSPRPGNGSSSNGSSRTWITTMPQSVRCSSMHTGNKSINPSEKACLLVSRRRPCPIDRGNPLWK